MGDIRCYIETYPDLRNGIEESAVDSKALTLVQEIPRNHLRQTGL